MFTICNFKADTGVGAAETYKLKNEKELETFFDTPRNIPFIFEEFIEGTLESFDGLVNREGTVVFYTSHKFNSGIMEVVTDDSELSYYSQRVIPEDLKEMGFR